MAENLSKKNFFINLNFIKSLLYMFPIIQVRLSLSLIMRCLSTARLRIAPHHMPQSHLMKQQVWHK